MFAFTHRFTDEISTKYLDKIDVLVFAAPKLPFSDGEISTIKAFINAGKSIICLETNSTESTLNSILGNYGVEFQKDSVVSVVFQKSCNPREAFISSWENPRFLTEDESVNRVDEIINIIYPNGGTLNVRPPSIPILSTGTMCYPFNRPVTAIYICPQSNGRIVAIGAVEIFSDLYIYKEANDEFCFRIFHSYLNSQFRVSDAEKCYKQISNYYFTTHMEELAYLPRSANDVSEPD